MRYRVLDLPTKGRAAFTPVPPQTAMASSYGLVRVSAAMGLLPVPVTSPSKSAPWLAVAGAQPSDVSPDVIAPDQYVPYATNMGPAADAGFGMATRRLNPLPVPALSGIYTPNVAFRVPAKIGGRWAMRWPGAFQRFPTTRTGG
jgi:hypothetical protein